MLQRTLTRLPLILIMGTIFFLSHRPGDSFNLPDITDLDKLLHCIAYGVLAATALFALEPHFRRSRPWASSLLVVGFCLLYGISDEFHQSFVPGRMPSIWDIVADVTGALLCVSLWYGIRPKRMTRPV